MSGTSTFAALRGRPRGHRRVPDAGLCARPRAGRGRRGDGGGHEPMATPRFTFGGRDRAVVAGPVARSRLGVARQPRRAQGALVRIAPRASIRSPCSSPTKGSPGWRCTWSTIVRDHSRAACAWRLTPAKGYAVRTRGAGDRREGPPRDHGVGERLLGGFRDPHPRIFASGRRPTTSSPRRSRRRATGPSARSSISRSEAAGLDSPTSA